jgi:hypothetical protein
VAVTGRRGTKHRLILGEENTIILLSILYLGKKLIDIIVVVVVRAA